MLMRDYTLLQEAVKLGGKVVTVEGLRRDAGGVPCVPDVGACQRPPLSKVHISPFVTASVEYTDGASLLKVERGHLRKTPKGGIRSKIGGFSSASRRRLMYMIARVKRDAVLPLFVTLTYPDKFPSARESKRHLDIFLKRIRRAFPVAGGIWKLEPQQRGAPHYHLLVWGAPLVVVDEINMTVSGLRYFIPSAWYEIAGGGDEKHLLWHEGLLGHGNKQCV